MQPSYGAPQANDVVVITSLGMFEVTGLKPDGGRYIRVRQNEYVKDANAREDALILQVLGPDKVPIAECRFASSYGVFRLELIDLDGDGNREFVSIVGEGRGTGAGGKELWILRLQGDVFHTLIKTPYSGYSGGGTGGVEWRYDHRYEHRSGAGGIAVVLTLAPLSKPVQKVDLSDIPQERTKVFEFKTHSIHALIGE